MKTTEKVDELVARLCGLPDRVARDGGHYSSAGDMVARLARWWLRRHRPGDVPARAMLMWVWSKQVEVDEGHEFVEIARPAE